MFGRWLQNPAVVARFEREMLAVGSLRHPAIIQATDGGEAEGVHFLVMELIDGIDGGALVQHLGPLPVADACEIARQAAIGMAYVHEQGIIHRDLKPSNVMVTQQGDVKVLDLGLARVVGEQLAEDDLTTVGQLMGTLDFMAPEQLEDSHEVDERADVYSLGATLFKLFTGRSPHAADPHEPLLSKLRRMATDPPKPLHECRPDAPTELCNLVDSMLSHNADDRPASMEGLAGSLGAFSQSSDLAERVKEATRLRKAQGRHEGPTGGKLTESLLGWESEVAKPRDLQGRPEHGRGFLKWTAVGLLMLVVAAMGVIITLQTTAGQLVIETTTPDVEVRLLKAGRPYRQLTVSQKTNSLRLGAGEYEIEILSDADSLEIENGRYTLKRGETWLAKIVHRKSANDLTIDAQPYGTRDDLQPDVDKPTYEGKTLAEWVLQLRQERSPKIYSKHARLWSSSPRAKTRQNRRPPYWWQRGTIRHRHPTRNADGRTSYLWTMVLNLFSRWDQQTVVTALTDEFDRRQVANVDFILYYLSRSDEKVRPFADEQLLAHVERIAADESSETRMQALSVLKKIGSQQVATRRLVAALSDHEKDVQLFAARQLIEMKSNVPLVVSTLRQTVRSGELRHRAEAAWLLGDLGVDAKPAAPELIAIVQDDDEAVSRAAAYQTPYFHSSGGGGGSLGMVSVKDAAIRALAEIGDESVVPVLTAEWQRRAYSGSRPNRSGPAWDSVPQQTVANTYGHKWVADAIEKLTGMRPETLRRSRSGKITTTWRVGRLSLVGAYGTAFTNARGSSSPAILDATLDAAKKLMPLAQISERSSAREYIENAGRLPGPAELELEIKLIELLAQADDPRLVLEPVLRRWRHYALGDRTWDPQEQAAAVDAYNSCADRIVRGTEDWTTKAAAQLFQLADATHWPAIIVLIQVLPELDREQQVAGVIRLLQQVAAHPNGYFADSIKKAATWLEDASHRAEIERHLTEDSGDAWEHLMLGLLQTGLADADATEILKTRFGNESVDRYSVLDKIIQSMDAEPGLAQVVIDLIEHPALDAPSSVTEDDGETTESSLRAARYLLMLQSVPERHRSNFVPLLNKYAETGKHGESASAQMVLKAWK